MPVTAPHYPLTSFGPSGTRTIVTIGRGARTVAVGGPVLVVIAGPCAVEGAPMLRAVARAVAGAGASALRGGAVKPRTSPYVFQGYGDEALEMLAEARALTALPVVTEVLDPREVDKLARVADVLQIGARSMTNVPLLTEAGRCGVPVLLKRGMSARLDEYLYAAEYVMLAGNSHLILCERGIRTFETSTRNTLDVAAVPLLKAETHLPVLVDPSHAAGRRSLVAPLAAAAIAAGADGLLVEVHPDPDAALSDGDQSLTLDGFADMMRALRPVAAAVGRVLPPARHDAVDLSVDTSLAASLDALRASIDATDRDLLDLTAQRTALARQAGVIKQRLGLPMLDAERERRVEDEMRAYARSRGLNEAYVGGAARALIELARASQDDLFRAGDTT